MHSKAELDVSGETNDGDDDMWNMAAALVRLCFLVSKSSAALPTALNGLSVSERKCEDWSAVAAKRSEKSEADPT